MGAGEKVQAPPRAVATAVKGADTARSLGKKQDGSRGSGRSLGAGLQSVG